jgi:hypothetical protein
VSDRIDEQALLLDPMSRIEPSSREVSVIFDGTSSRVAWPDEGAGIIVSGLTDAQAKTLIRSGRDRAELYVTNRVTHNIPRRRYLLTDLEGEAPGRFLFKAAQGFDLGLHTETK